MDADCLHVEGLCARELKIASRLQVWLLRATYKDSRPTGAAVPMWRFVHLSNARDGGRERMMNVSWKRSCLIEEN